jgi:hypothetical protein
MMLIPTRISHHYDHVSPIILDASLLYIKMSRQSYKNHWANETGEDPSFVHSTMLLKSNVFAYLAITRGDWSHHGSFFSCFKGQELVSIPKETPTTMSSASL